jgi:hypothetical protein
MATSGKKFIQWQGLKFLTEAVSIPRTVVASVMGLYPRCVGQLHSLSILLLGAASLRKVQKIWTVHLFLNITSYTYLNIIIEGSW